MADIEGVRQDTFRDSRDTELASMLADATLTGTFSRELKYQGFRYAIETLLTGFRPEETLASCGETGSQQQALLAEVLGRIVERNGALARLGEANG